MRFHDGPAVLVAMSLALAACAAQARLSAGLDCDRQPFEGEVFTLTLWIRAAGVRLGQEFELQSWPPDSVLQRLSDFEELAPVRQQVGAEIQETRTFRCRCRIPRSGTVELAPVLRVSLLSRVMTLFGPRTAESPQEVPVRPLTVHVRPLPAEGRPADFSGAVGALDFVVEVMPEDVSAGDIVRLKGRIRGSGYLDAIAPPRLTNAPGFKVYDPQVLPASHDAERAWEQVLIPLTPQACEIPAVSFSFFDPSSDGGQYRTLTRGPFPLRVREAPATASEPGYRPFRPGDESPAGAPAGRRLPLKPLVGLPEAWQTLAEQAAQAYADGYADGAVRALRQLREAGCRTPELDINLGHALLEQGHAGPAMLAYARAARRLPRDPSLKAGVARIRATRGALPPPWSGIDRFAQRLTVAEWVAAAAVLGGSLVAWELIRRFALRRRGMDLLGIGLLAGLALGGVAVARRDQTLRQEAVVLRPESARFAPWPQSVPLFTVPEASVVRVLDRRRDWLKIQAGENRGWLPASAAAFPEFLLEP